MKRLIPKEKPKWHPGRAMIVDPCTSPPTNTAVSATPVSITPKITRSPPGVPGPPTLEAQARSAHSSKRENGGRDRGAAGRAEGPSVQVGDRGSPASLHPPLDDSGGRRQSEPRQPRARRGWEKDHARGVWRGKVRKCGAAQPATGWGAGNGLRRRVTQIWTQKDRDPEVLATYARK